MELIGSLFIVLALGVLVALFLARPFLRGPGAALRIIEPEAQQREHERSALLAERDRVLTALQELDFDYALGKVPEEEYPTMRADLLRSGANILRQLDTFEANGQAATAEDRIEAEVTSRRADGRRVRQAEPLRDAVLAQSQTEGAAKGQAEGGTNGHSRHSDEIEDLIASRKRARQESAAGFCPRCGKPVQKSDMFCSKCGNEV